MDLKGPNINSFYLLNPIMRNSWIGVQLVRLPIHIRRCEVWIHHRRALLRGFEMGFTSSKPSLFYFLFFHTYSDAFNLSDLTEQWSKKLTAPLHDSIAASTSSSEENETNPNPLDFEVPGTLDTFALRAFPLPEKNLISDSVVTVLARFPT